MSKRSFRMWADDKPQYDEDDLPRSRRVAHYDPVGEALAITAELRELKKLAKELAERLAFYTRRWNSDGMFCNMCLEDMPRHADDCLITRARKMGLFEANHE